jgi:RluA family pseudouridine synthase
MNSDNTADSPTALDPSRILFEDAHLICVDKHAGELVVADRWGKETRILLRQVGAWLRAQGHQADAKGRDIFPVHRLDRDTSGAVVFAKNAEAHRRLSKLFEGRDVSKVYWLLTSGCPAWQELTVDLPLSRLEGKRGRGRGIVDHVKGKPAQTAFRVLKRFHDIALLEARPHTGRLHQIRLHAREAGFPLLWDPHYGIRDWQSAHYGQLPLARVPLHARELRFTHPFTGRQVTCTAPLDPDLSELLAHLERAA